MGRKPKISAEQKKWAVLEVLEKGMILVLCDNGCEFSRYDELERISPRVRVFFADPYRSCDKANCERNHEFFRYCIPKGVSFDAFTIPVAQGFSYSLVLSIPKTNF